MGGERGADARRWRLGIGLALAALLVSLAMVPVAAGEAVDVPDVTARSVYAFDPATGEVILEQDADERGPIGSVTKVMTALVVRDHAALDEEVTIVEDDLVEPGFSTMWLQPGDTLSVEQLLTGMLVVSGGDAAKALARHVGSDLAGTDNPGHAVAAFVEEMNAKASELQIGDTRFANPDGEDAEDAWSTARDVAIMYAFLQADPVLADISAQTDYAFSSVEATPYAGSSTNQLAGTYGVTGAKTGSTINAGGCLVLSREAPGGGSEVIAILGSELEYDETTWTLVVDERWTDARVVMDAIDSEWTPGQNLAAEPVETAAPEVARENPGEVDTFPDAAAPETTLAQQPDDDDPSGPSTAPLLAVTVASGVLAFAGVFAWSRIAPRRSDTGERMIEWS
jgi:D-alanyl-D-alanine carboxypeptidase (penicillin-binding protein 5/6)